jgi:hypothetical protein
MPDKQAASQQIRTHLIEKLQTYASTLWKDIRLEADYLTTLDLIETAIEGAKRQVGIAIQRKLFEDSTTTVHVQEAAAPFYQLIVNKPSDVTLAQPLAMVISDPRTDDRAIQAARETDKCHNCGKTGHWAKDYRSKLTGGKSGRSGRSGRPDKSGKPTGGNNKPVSFTKNFEKDGEKFIPHGTLHRVISEVRNLADYRKRGRTYAAIENGNANDKNVTLATDSEFDEKGKSDPYERYEERTINDNITAFMAGEAIPR